MTSSAEPLLADFLAYTLAGETPCKQDGEIGGGRAPVIFWHWLGEGILQLEPAESMHGMPSVLLSAGIHGDETAPIELLSALVADIAAGRLALACRLLVVLGNVPAMRAARRYFDDDLNRLFGGRHRQLPQSREAPRAAQLEAAANDFFAQAASLPGTRWHLDMHTAIRASVFEQFALLPYTGAQPSRAMLEWCADARIAAALIHTEKGTTYSFYTADMCDALACTLELGKVGRFGENDLARFADADAAVRGLVAGMPREVAAPMPKIFTVIGQITKQSDAFELFVASDVANFTPFAQGTLLARDTDYQYVVAREEERIVFPNPGVKPGLRAGLLVVDTTAETLGTLA